MAAPSWKLDDDLQTVTVTFPSDPPVAIKLTASDVDDVLRNLGEFRAYLKPGIPSDCPSGQKVAAIPNPRWRTVADALMGDSVVQIRDPRFGWLHYLIPRDEARKLAGFLQVQVDSQPPGEGSGKPQ